MIRQVRSIGAKTIRAIFNDNECCCRKPDLGKFSRPTLVFRISKLRSLTRLTISCLRPDNYFIEYRKNYCYIYDVVEKLGL